MKDYTKIGKYLTILMLYWVLGQASVAIAIILLEVHLSIYQYVGVWVGILALLLYKDLCDGTIVQVFTTIKPPPAPPKIGKHYLLTLQNGETKIIKFTQPYYRCSIDGDASDHFCTMEQIKADVDIHIIDGADPYFFFQDYIGRFRDETHFFNTYKMLRNPIVKLELITE